MPAPFGWEKKGSNPFLISYYSEEGNFKHTAGTWERKTGDQAYGIMGGETSSAADIPLSVVQQMGERQFGVRPLGPDGIRAGTSMRDPTYGDGLSDRLRAENSKAVEEAARYKAYWSRYAPKLAAPGETRVDWLRVSSRTGRMEESRVVYDEYGRQIMRVDYSTHMRPVHSDPHLHEYTWNQYFPVSPYETTTNFNNKE